MYAMDAVDKSFVIWFHSNPYIFICIITFINLSLQLE